jgi:hypothetical protein
MPRAAGDAAVWKERGSGAELDLIDMHAERLSGDLRQRGPCALAHVGAGGVDRRGSVGAERGAGGGREIRARKDGRMVYLWRAVDAEGEVLDVLVQRKRNKYAGLKLMRKLLKKCGFVPDRLITDDLRSYAAAAHDLGIGARQRHLVSAPSHRTFRAAAMSTWREAVTAA